MKLLIFARAIPGNEAVVRDGETGFLFRTQEEFVEKVESVAGKNGEGVREEERERERERVIANAFDFVRKTYDFERECEDYRALVEKHLP